MRLSTRQGLRAGIMFGLFFGLFQGLAHGAVGGVAAGLAAGGMFGLCIGFVLRRKERLWAALREPYAAEGLEHQGPANCAIGPGYLMLTAKRLVWIPNSEKDRAKKIIISRDAIAKVEQASGIGAQIRVVTTTAESVQFVVSDRKAWLAVLRDQRVPLPTARVV